LLVLDLDAEDSCEVLDRADEVRVLDLLHEADRVAAHAATEALERPASRCHGEARRALLVERAEALVRAPRLARPDVALDERHDRGGRLDRLDRAVLDPRHQYARAKRSVMPAR